VSEERRTYGAIWVAVLLSVMAVSSTGPVCVEGACVMRRQSSENLTVPLDKF